MSAWNDFNDAEDQQSFDLIPKGTVVRVCLNITPGGYSDPSQGWEDGWATQSDETGAVYLAGVFTVMEGEYAKRKVWSNIGLHSPKGDKWASMGRSFIRAILHSARNVHPEDMSPEAAAKRRIDGFHELEGIEFVARIDIERDVNGDQKNVIKQAVVPGQPEYAAPGAAPSTAPARPAARQQARPATHAAPSRAAAVKAPVATTPAWAK